MRPLKFANFSPGSRGRHDRCGTHGGDSGSYSVSSPYRLRNWGSADYDPGRAVGSRFRELVQAFVGAGVIVKGWHGAASIRLIQKAMGALQWNSLAIFIYALFVGLSRWDDPPSSTDVIPAFAIPQPMPPRWASVEVYDVLTFGEIKVEKLHALALMYLGIHMGGLEWGPGEVGSNKKSQNNQLA